jgi:hypothetical protein
VTYFVSSIQTNPCTGQDGRFALEKKKFIRNKIDFLFLRGLLMEADDSLIDLRSLLS